MRNCGNGWSARDIIRGHIKCVVVIQCKDSVMDNSTTRVEGYSFGFKFSFLPGYIGVSAAAVLSNAGAAYGTAKAGLGIGSMGVRSPQLVMRNMM